MGTRSNFVHGRWTLPGFYCLGFLDLNGGISRGGDENVISLLSFYPIPVYLDITFVICFIIYY